jgi:hypothetical protein
MFTAGQTNTFQATATGFPTPLITLAALPAGLPAGITFTDNQDGTGMLTIDSTVEPGIYSLIMTAQNPFGTNITAANPYGTPATQSFTLTVSPPGGGESARPSPRSARSRPGSEVVLTCTTSTRQPLSLPIVSANLISGGEKPQPVRQSRVNAVFAAGMEGSRGIASARSKAHVLWLENDVDSGWFGVSE